VTRSCTPWWIAVVMRLSTFFFFLSTTLLGVRAVPVDITFTSIEPGNTYTPPSRWNQVVGSFVVTDSDPNQKYHALRVHGGPDKDVFNVNDFDLRITKAGEGKSTLTVIIRALDWDKNFVDRTFTITGNNVVPTDIKIIPGTYSPPSTSLNSVGTLVTTDANTDQAHTYTIVGGPEAAIFVISATQLVIANPGLTRTGLVVRIRSTDPFGQTVEKDLTVNYINVRPSQITLTPPTYTPPSTEGMVVGTLGTLDDNDGDTFTYKVENVMEGYLFTTSGDSLRLKNAGEVRTGLSITVTTTDSGGLSYSQNFTINTNNVLPSLITVTPDQYNPSLPLTYVGSLTVTDVNPEQTHSFSIVGGTHSQLFSIVNTPGGPELRLIQVVQTTGLQVIVRVVDSAGGSYSQTLTINTYNAPPTDILLTKYTYVPPSVTNLYVGTLSAVDDNPEQVPSFMVEGTAWVLGDADSWIPGTFTAPCPTGTRMMTQAECQVHGDADSRGPTTVVHNASLAPGCQNYLASGGVVYNTATHSEINPLDIPSITRLYRPICIWESTVFKIEESFKLTFLKPEVHETGLAVRIKVSDGVSSLTKNLYIDYVNVAPSTVYFASGGTFTPPSSNQDIGVLGVADPNARQHHTWALTSNPATDNALFTIGTATGIVRSGASSLRMSTYTIEVTVFDNYQDPLASNTGLNYTALLNITALNAVPTDIVLSTDTWMPPSTANQVVCTLTAVDGNVDQDHTFSILPGNDGHLFNLLGNQLRITSAGGGHNRLLVNLQVDDGHGGIFTKQVIIKSMPVAPYDLVFTGSSYYYPPSPHGFVVGTLNGQDYNTDDHLVYTVVGGADEGGFYVEGKTLYMRPGQRKNVLHVDVAVGDPRRFKTISLAFTAINLPPTAVTLSNPYFENGQAAAQVVGTLAAVDENADDTHTYAVVGGTDANLFTVQGASLMLAAGTWPTVLQVTVRATDPHGETAEAALTLRERACPKDYTAGPQKMCWRFRSTTATVLNQMSYCNGLAPYSSMAGLADLVREDQSWINTLMGGYGFSQKAWVRSCFEHSNVSTGTGTCMTYEVGSGSANPGNCYALPCTGDRQTLCTVPFGGTVPLPDQTLVVGSITGSAYMPDDSGSLVTFAAQNSAGDSNAFPSAYSYVYRDIDPTTPFTYQMEVHIDRFHTDALSGILFKNDATHYLAAVLTDANNALGTKTLQVMYKTTAGTFVDTVTILNDNWPETLQVTMANEKITCRLTYKEGQGNPVVREFTGFPQGSVTRVGIMTYGHCGLPHSGSCTSTTTWAAYSQVIHTQGPIKVMKLLPALAAGNVPTATTELVVLFDRIVQPGTLCGAGGCTLTLRTDSPSTNTSVQIQAPAVSVSGYNLTFTLPHALAPGTVYSLELPRGAVKDHFSQDAFPGLSRWIFGTAPTPASALVSTPNITLALDTVLDRFHADAFCNALRTVFPSQACADVEVLAVEPGSVVVDFQLNNVLAAGLPAVLATLQKALVDNTLNNAMQAAGLGAILPGTATISNDFAEPMHSLVVTLTPDTPGGQTTVRIAATTSMTGLPAGGYVELILPPALQIDPTASIVLKVEAAGMVVYYNASSVVGQVVGFQTGFATEINQGTAIAVTIQNGVTMPSVCWGLNEWIWGMKTFATPTGPVFNYILANPPTDSCGGQYALKKNAPPVVQIADALQWTYEDTAWYISKPIQVVDDAVLAADAYYTVSVTLDRPGSKLQLWPAVEQRPPSWNVAGTQPWIINGTDNSSHIRFAATPFQLQYVLSNVYYYPEPDWSGVENLTVVVEDNGYCCDLVPQVGHLTVPLYVVPVNDGPEVAIPGPASRTIVEDGNLTFSCQVADKDAGSGNLEVTVTVDRGTLSVPKLATAPGVTLLSGAASGATSAVLTGSQAALNVALMDMLFFPTPNTASSVVGNANVACVVSDLGNGPLVVGLPELPSMTFPNSPALTASAALSVHILGLNDPPLISISTPGGVNMTIDEDTQFTFSVIVLDLDPSILSLNQGSGVTTLVLRVPYGTLTSTAAMTATQAGYTQYTTTGTIAEINAMSFTYTPPKHWFGQDTISVSFYDSAADGGYGPSMVARATTYVLVEGVNDGPFLNYTGRTDAHGVTVFHRSNPHPIPVHLVDVDMYSGELDLYINATHGLLSVDSSVASVTTVVQGTLSGDKFLHLKGSGANLQKALWSLTYMDQFPHREPIYHITDDTHNTDSVYVHISDQGQTGKGSALSSTVWIPLRITSTIYETCQAYLDAPGHNGYCGCYFETLNSQTEQWVWTRLPTTAQSKIFLADNKHLPRRFMQGCCADLLPVQREFGLMQERWVRDGELGLCSQLSAPVVIPGACPKCASTGL